MWKKGRVRQSTVIVEMATLHTGACTRNRVITYSLDLLSRIHGAVHTEGRAEYQAGTYTRRWGADLPTNWIHGAMHMEERVEYHCPQ